MKLSVALPLAVLATLATAQIQNYKSPCLEKCLDENKGLCDPLRNWSCACSDRGYQGAMQNCIDTQCRGTNANDVAQRLRKMTCK